MLTIGFNYYLYWMGYVEVVKPMPSSRSAEMRQKLLVKSDGSPSAPKVLDFTTKYRYQSLYERHGVSHGYGIMGMRRSVICSHP